MTVSSNSKDISKYHLKTTTYYTMLEEVLIKSESRVFFLASGGHEMVLDDNYYNYSVYLKGNTISKGLPVICLTLVNYLRLGMSSLLPQGYDILI